MTALSQRKLTLSTDDLSFDHDGFLVEGSDGLQRLETVAAHRCVVVLGAPGDGKSVLLRDPRWCPHGATVHRVDLAAVESVGEAFDDSAIDAWRNGTGELCLILDSLDEAKSRVANIGRVLGRRLRQLPAERLWLRLACRAADWPSTLHDDLRECFGGDHSTTPWFLAPFSAREVGAIAAAAGVDGDRFVGMVRERAVVPFAIQPLTLRFLLSTYQHDGTFPDDVNELFEQGLQALSREWDSGRVDARTTGDILASERLAIAQRLAAMTLLSGRHDISEAPNSQHLSFDDVAGGTEPSGSAETAVSGPHLRETTATALFHTTGNTTFRFAHRTFAEHLCARFLAKLTAVQVRSVLVGFDGLIHQHLRGVAAWLVASDSQRFGWIASTDPELFLSVPVAAPNDAIKALIVDGIFAQARRGDRLYAWGENAQRLRYPELTDQLRPKLRSAVPLEECAAAIQVAHDTGLVELLDELTAIACDPRAPHQLRDRAASAVRDLAERPSDALTPILAEDALDDYEELRGIALDLCWPDRISTEEMFASLRRPRQFLAGGEYQAFIRRIPRRLSTGEVRAAVRWATSTTGARGSLLCELADMVVERALGELTTPEVVETLAQLVVSRLERHQGLFLDDMPRPDSREIDRKAIGPLQRAVLPFVEPERCVGLLTSAGRQALFDATDLALLIALFDDDILSGSRPTIGNLVKYLFHPSWPGHAELVLTLPESHPLRTEYLAYWIAPVDLDGPGAAEQRAEWQRLRGNAADSATDDDTIQALVTFVDRTVGGEIELFWRICVLLHAPPGRQHIDNEFEADLTALPRWTTIPDPQRAQVLQAAYRYVEARDCAVNEWLGKNVLHWPAVAGLSALLLIARYNRKWLSDAPARLWRDWTPIIVAHRNFPGLDESDDRIALMHLAARAAPDVVLDTTDILIRQASVENQPIGRDALFDVGWSAELERRLVDKLDTDSLSELPDDEVVRVLLRHAPERAHPILIRRLQDPTVPAAKRTTAAVLLLASPHWQLALEAILTDKQLGQQVVESASHRDISIEHLNVGGLQDLYLWLVATYPYENDENTNSSWLGPHGLGRMLRDAILQRLRGDGTLEAVTALGNITAKLPQYSWLGYTARSARELARSETWQPISPEQLLALRASATRWLVQTDLDLLALAVDAFDAIQHRLIGSPPEAHLLWNTTGDQRTPKTEDEISDYLCNELRKAIAERNIVVNREVQIRRNKPGGVGERTDIHIQATPSGDTDVGLTLPIEVKGAWNTDLLSDLEGQLLDRYMADLATPIGIYLVAWPNLASWTSDDQRRRRLGRLNVDDVHRELEQQATNAQLRRKKVVVIHVDISYLRSAQPSR